jgi:hypothetical protein
VMVCEYLDAITRAVELTTALLVLAHTLRTKQ